MYRSSTFNNPYSTPVLPNVDIEKNLPNFKKEINGENEFSLYDLDFYKKDEG